MLTKIQNTKIYLFEYDLTKVFYIKYLDLT